MKVSDLIYQHRCRHGIFRHYKTDRGIGSHLKAFGEWAEEEVFLFSRLLKDRMVALDVGAHVGTHTVVMSRLVGPQGRVVAFEPQPRIVPLLTANVLTNGAAHNTAILCAMCSAVRDSRLVLTEGTSSYPHSSGTVAYKSPDIDQDSSVEIPTAETSIDALHFPRVDFIKIDVEGNELSVLTGGEKTLREHSPIIYYEQIGDINRKPIIQFLASIGYTLFVHYARAYNLGNFNRLVVPLPDTVETNILAIPTAQANTILSQLPIDINLVPVEGHPREAKVPRGPWTLPTDAYNTTALSARQQEVQWRRHSVADLVNIDLDVSDWHGTRIVVEDFKRTCGIEMTLDISGVSIHDANIQALFHLSNSQSSASPWYTLYHSRSSPGSAGTFLLRLMWESVDREFFESASGSGEIELRGLAARPCRLIVLNLCVLMS